MHVRFRQPLTAEQGMRIDRARLALKLHRLPHELDAAPLIDIADLLAVIKTDHDLAEMEARKARTQALSRARTARRRR